MTSLPIHPLDSDSPQCEDWHVLQYLRDRPEVLEAVVNTSGTEFQIQKALREQFPEAVVRGALSLVDMRRKAAGKFSQADRMWLNRVGFEQATAELVAQHKAARFSGHVWDLCCGIGSDTAALAQRCETIAVDLDPAMCLRTKWNAQVLNPQNAPLVLCADVTRIRLAPDLVHIDPDRRPGGNPRAVKIEEYVPGPEFLARLQEKFRGGAIKLSPAANFGGKFPNAEVELISLHGECKEATIWFGELAQPTPWRATVLPARETLAGNPLDSFPPVTPLQQYLYDPDPAVVRAGLVDLLAETLGLARLDPEEEYLTGEQLVHSPFVRGFEILAELPNNPRAIRQHFRESDFGEVEIKCRHIPVNVEAVRQKLPLPGTTRGVLIFARVSGKARAVVARRV